MQIDLMSMLMSIPAIIIAISFHEAAHAYVAHKLGDDTAKNMGRMTINPLAHLDPIGVIMLLVFHFGWAKPVEFNPNNFKNKKKGTVLTALAGPVSNFLTAFVFAIIICFMMGFGAASSSLGVVLMQIFEAIVQINIGLGVFNFIPIPPLDGSKILAAFLPSKYYFKYIESQNILQIVLIVLVLTNIISYILMPIVGVIYSWIWNGAVFITINILQLFM